MISKIYLQYRDTLIVILPLHTLHQFKFLTLH